MAREDWRCGGATNPAEPFKEPLKEEGSLFGGTSAQREQLLWMVESVRESLAAQAGSTAEAMECLCPSSVYSSETLRLLLALEEAQSHASRASSLKKKIPHCESLRECRLKRVTSTSDTGTECSELGEDASEDDEEDEQEGLTVVIRKLEPLEPLAAQQGAGYETASNADTDGLEWPGRRDVGHKFGRRSSSSQELMRAPEWIKSFPGADRQAHVRRPDLASDVKNFLETTHCSPTLLSSSLPKGFRCR
jgi:hypothetical protein